VHFIIKSTSSLLAELKDHFTANPELFEMFNIPKDYDFKSLPADVHDERMNDICNEMYGGKLVLLEGELDSMQTTFQNHYTAVNDTPALYNTLTIPWLAFKETALEGMVPDEFILGLIHCYDTTTGNWYAAAERFTFSGYSGPNEYPITSTNTLFNILSDNTLGNYTGGLEEYNGHLYDPVYFSNVLSDNTPANPSVDVNRVTFAWEEIKQLHCDNKSNIPGADDSLFSISFCSISSDYSADIPNSALVAFPHCVAMYMNYDGVPLLNNNAIITGAMFINKAADYGSLCPARCASYNWPAGLVPKNC